MRNLDGVSNLEAVVIHDLRDIGVKIPKIRKQIHSVVSVSTRASGKGCVCGTGTRTHASRYGHPTEPYLILTLTLTLTLLTQGRVKFRGRRLSVRLSVISRPCGRTSWDHIGAHRTTSDHMGTHRATSNHAVGRELLVLIVRYRGTDTMCPTITC